MKFTTPCFVRIEDADEREKLDIWLRRIGRKTLASKNQSYAVASEDSILWCNLDGCTIDVMISQGYIDCSTNVELFKALAAMNDENCSEQWFVSDCLLKFERLKGVVKTEHGKRSLCRGEWFKVLIDEARDIRAAWIGFRRPKSIAHCASIEEIIKHFKNRKE